MNVPRLFKRNPIRWRTLYKALTTCVLASLLSADLTILSTGESINLANRFSAVSAHETRCPYCPALERYTSGTTITDRGMPVNLRGLAPNDHYTSSSELSV